MLVTYGCEYFRLVYIPNPDYRSNSNCAALLGSGTFHTIELCLANQFHLISGMLLDGKQRIIPD